MLYIILCMCIYKRNYKIYLILYIKHIKLIFYVVLCCARLVMCPVGWQGCGQAGMLCHWHCHSCCRREEALPCIKHHQKYNYKKYPISSPQCSEDMQ